MRAAKKPRTKPAARTTGETAKVRMGSGERVHLADVIQDVDKEGRPIKGIWVRCSKSGPTLWRADMAQPSAITRLPDDAPVTCIKCDPHAAHEVRGPKSDLSLQEWKGLLGQIVYKAGGKMYTRPRTKRVKLRVPIGMGPHVEAQVKEFQTPKRTIIVTEAETP